LKGDADVDDIFESHLSSTPILSPKSVVKIDFANLNIRKHFFISFQRFQHRSALILVLDVAMRISLAPTSPFHVKNSTIICGLQDNFE